jgi:hypothetical protein
MAENWEYEEAIECFKVIDTSLRCYYGGGQHMYRAIAAQLRILFCEKDPKPLLLRLFPDIGLTPLQQIKSTVPGTFPDSVEHFNTVKISGSDDASLSYMPFEITKFFNGVTDCRLLFSDSKNLIPLNEWVEQVVSLYPEHAKPLSISEWIKTIADRGGGAHVHKSKDVLITNLKAVGPFEEPILHAAIIIAIGRVAQVIGFSIIQLYERFGTTGTLPFQDFDKSHPSVLNAAKVPEEYYDHPREIINLMSMNL